MDADSQRILQEQRTDIIGHLIDVESVVDQLISSNALSPGQMETIMGKTDQSSKVRELLDLLTSKSDGFPKFVDALLETGNDELAFRLISSR